MTSDSTAPLGVARADRVFYASMAVIVAAAMFAGFAPTFYLRAWSDLDPLQAALFAHGVAGTAWVLLFALQPVLIAARRLKLHRRLGVAGAVIAAAMYATGLAAIGGLERMHAGESAATLAVHLFTNVAPLTEFIAFVAFGIAYRRVPDAHKRWMLLATISLLPAATARFYNYFDLGDWNVPTYAAFALANLAYDALVRRRIHPVSLWGAATLLLVELVTDGLLRVV